MPRESYEQDREDQAVNEQNYLGPDEPSEFLDTMTRLDIHRITLMEQERQAYVLVKAVEQTLLEANERWEQITAELNALGGEPC